MKLRDLSKNIYLVSTRERIKIKNHLQSYGAFKLLRYEHNRNLFF